MKRTQIPRWRITIKKRIADMMREHFKCSYTAIYQSLDFFCNSDKGREMRKYALDHGGELICENVDIE